MQRIDLEEGMKRAHSPSAMRRRAMISRKESNAMKRTIADSAIVSNTDVGNSGDEASASVERSGLAGVQPLGENAGMDDAHASEADAGIVALQGCKGLNPHQPPYPGCDCGCSRSQRSKSGATVSVFSAAENDCRSAVAYEFIARRACGPAGGIDSAADSPG